MTERVAEIIELVASVVGVPPAQLSLSSSMENVPEWDSLAHLTICMQFQEQFGVQMDMDTIATSTSIEKLNALRH